MLFDELSLFIVNSIYESTLEKKCVSTWELSKKFNHNEVVSIKDESEKEVFIRKKAVMIRERLKAMVRDGIAVMKKTSRNSKKNDPREHYEFQLLGNKVLRYEFKFPNKKSIGIAVMEKNGKWSVFEL